MTHSQETPDQSQKAEPLPETREPLKAYQRLSEKIQDAIEKGGLKVGDKLPPERALAETFGVSPEQRPGKPSARISEQGIPQEPPRRRDVHLRFRSRAADRRTAQCCRHGRKVI